MTYLTPEDGQFLDRLSIGTVCDLRTAEERLREPTYWGTGATRVSWEYDRRVISLRHLIEGPGFSAQQARKAMLKLYRLLPQIFAEPFGAVFGHLAGSKLPLVFNCSAGKDRTGVLAALILACLGVPREQVIADYVLTDTAIDLERELFEHPQGSVGAGDEYTFLSRVPRVDRQPLFISSPDYLNAAFEQIDRDHGSIDAYFRKALRLSPPHLDAIRENLLDA
jgi:protein-tyrosine phosphatase